MCRWFDPGYHHKKAKLPGSSSSFPFFLILCAIQLPAKGLPKIPTANSPHTSTKSSRMISKKMNLDFLLFTNLKTSSNALATRNKSIKAITKSDKVQLTSFVNCMAIKGINRKIGIARIMLKNRLFFIIVSTNNSLPRERRGQQKIAHK